MDQLFETLFKAVKLQLKEVEKMRASISMGSEDEPKLYEAYSLFNAIVISWLNSGLEKVRISRDPKKGHEHLLVVECDGFRFRFPESQISELDGKLYLKVAQKMKKQDRRFIVETIGRGSHRELFLVTEKGPMLIAREFFNWRKQNELEWETRLGVWFDYERKNPKPITEPELIEHIGEEFARDILDHLDRHIEEYAKRGELWKSATSTYERWRAGEIRVGDAGRMVYGGGNESRIRVTGVDGDEISIVRVSVAENTLYQNDGYSSQSSETITIEELLKHPPVGFHYGGDQIHQKWLLWCMEQL